MFLTFIIKPIHFRPYVDYPIDEESEIVSSEKVRRLCHAFNNHVPNAPWKEESATITFAEGVFQEVE